MECSYEGLDYRYLPDEYLDKNIPRGRGMVKWQPFATMPEQFQRVKEMMADNLKVSKPSFENTQMVEIEEALRKNQGAMVIIRYWSEGIEEMMECQLEYIDDDSKMILCRKSDALLYIHFNHIYEVTAFNGLFDTEI